MFYPNDHPLSQSLFQIVFVSHLVALTNPSPPHHHHIIESVDINHPKLNNNRNEQKKNRYKTRNNYSHAQISSTVLRSATTYEISEQHDDHQPSQCAAHGNRNYVGRIDGITVLGQVIAIRVPIVERLPLDLGQGNGRWVLLHGNLLCYIEHLRAVAVVRHALRNDRRHVLHTNFDILVDWNKIALKSHSIISSKLYLTCSREAIFGYDDIESHVHLVLCGCFVQPEYKAQRSSLIFPRYPNRRQTL